VPHSLDGHPSMTYTRAHTRMPEHAIINLKNVSHRIAAEITLIDALSTGVIACQGGNMAGWSLYLDEQGIPTYLYNWFGHEFTFLKADGPLGLGHHLLEMHYAHDGGFAAGGLASLYVDSTLVSQARIERTVPVVFSMSGETFDVGRDTGSPVGPYPHNFPFAGEIHGVTLERLTEPDEAVKIAERKARFAAGLSSQ
jgi:hypothetical protein